MVTCLICPRVSGTQQNMMPGNTNDNNNKQMMLSEPECHRGDQQVFRGHGSEREILREMDQRKGVRQKP